MLKKNIIQKLNKQMNFEFYSSNLYLQMSAWCNNNVFEGSANFFKMHSKEEMKHMMKLFDYLNDNCVMPIIDTINAPNNTFSSFYDVMEKAYLHEKLITESIHNITHESLSNKDYSTFIFLQWYISEQQEEERLFKKIIDRLLLVGNTNEGIFLIDKELNIK